MEALREALILQEFNFCLIKLNILCRNYTYCITCSSTTMVLLSIIPWNYSSMIILIITLSNMFVHNFHYCIATTMLLSRILSITYSQRILSIVSNIAGGYVRQLSFHLLACIKWNKETVMLREKCPYSEFFWSVFSRIWTE